MVKKKGIVWNYFTKKVYGSQITAFCKFCDASYVQNATRMEKHVVKCNNCPDTIKQEFLKAIKNKKAKSVMELKLASHWSSDGANRTDSNVTLKNLKEWQYINKNKDHEISKNDEETLDSKSWNENSTSHNSKPEEILIHENWSHIEADENCDNSKSSLFEDQPEEDEEQEIINPKLVNTNRRLSQLSPQNVPPLDSSVIHNRIQQESYLEKLVLRRVAEVELKKKTLEFEKFKWEFEKEKAQYEVRWAHECRMMQLKEEHQEQLIKQILNKSTNFT